jgi:hypothetical protein
MPDFSTYIFQGIYAKEHFRIFFNLSFFNSENLNDNAFFPHHIPK